MESNLIYSHPMNGPQWTACLAEFYPMNGPFHPIEPHDYWNAGQIQKDEKKDQKTDRQSKILLTTA